MEKGYSCYSYFIARLRVPELDRASRQTQPQSWKVNAEPQITDRELWGKPSHKYLAKCSRRENNF